MKVSVLGPLRIVAEVTGQHSLLLTCALLVVCAAVAVLSASSQWSPSIRTVLVVAVVARLLVVVLARHHTPADVAVIFRRTGELVRLGKDPATTLPRYQWNFLPLMPYVHALEQMTGLPWWFAGKICPVAADVGVAVLLFRLTHRTSTAWQYALNPVPILVSAWHGQVEPTSLVLVLLAVLLLRREELLLAGLVFGAAIATKTWPLIFLPGLILLMSWPQRCRFAVALVVPLILLFTSQVIWLHAPARAAAKVVIGYRSAFGNFGWSGVLHQLGLAGIGYAGPNIDKLAFIGSAVLGLCVLTLLTLCWRRVDGLVMTGLILLVFYVVTGGFGIQYMLWCIPVLLMLRWREATLFLVSAEVFVVGTYVFFYTGAIDRNDYILLSCVVVASAALCLVRLFPAVRRGLRAPVRWGVPVESAH